MNTVEFRAHIRTNVVAPGYNGWVHFWRTTLTCFAGIAFCVWLMQDVAWRERWRCPQF